MAAEYGRPLCLAPVISIFFLLSSPMCEFRMQSEMCCTRLAETQDAKIRHLRPIAQLCGATSSQLRHISTIGKKLNSSISSRCPHNMANFGPLTADIGSRVWGAPAKFNGFRVLASLLHRRHPPEVNQTLHDLWPSPGLVHYIYIFGGSCPWQKFATCKLHLASKSCVLLGPILAALLHGTPAAGLSQTLRRCTRAYRSDVSRTITFPDRRFPDKLY